MNINETIEKVFLTKDYKLILTDKGLTNKNYLLKILNKKYMVRVPYPDASQIIEREHELIAIDCVKGQSFDIAPIYYDESTGIKITPYIEGAVEYKDTQDVNKIEKVAKLLRRFHSLNLQSSESFNPYERYLQYKSHISSPSFDLSQYEPIMNKIARETYTPCLCHNDVVSGNLLFTKQQTYLIDYEYAANNDPLFDVISFLSENEIFDENLRERFYAVYFDEMNDSVKQRLIHWEIFQDVLWCTWAMMMEESRHEPIYQEIAKAKYKALQSINVDPR